MSTATTAARCSTGKPHQRTFHHDRGVHPRCRIADVADVVLEAVVGCVLLRRSRSRQAFTTMRYSQLLTAESWRKAGALRCALSIASCSASAASSGLRLVICASRYELAVVTVEQLLERVPVTGDVRCQQLWV